MNAGHWLVVIGHELAHAAEWQRYGNPGAGQTHGRRVREVDRKVLSAMRGADGWLVSVIRQLPPWPE